MQTYMLSIVFFLEQFILENLISFKKKTHFLNFMKHTMIQSVVSKGIYHFPHKVVGANTVKKHLTDSIKC